jgi:hypothetical protein
MTKRPATMALGMGMLLGGLVGLFIGLALMTVASLGANARPCDTCTRPELLDLMTWGGRLLVLLAIVDLVALGALQVARRRR